jgi:hypothetical protein
MTIESADRGGASSALVEAVRRAGVHDERVIEAFQEVARRRFVPLDAMDRAAFEGVPPGPRGVKGQWPRAARRRKLLSVG